MVGLAVAALPSSALAAAAAQPVDARGATVGAVALAIGKQTRVSVSLKGDVTSRPARPVRGNLTPQAALRQLADSAGLELQSISNTAFILSPRRAPPKAKVVRVASRDMAPIAPIVEAPDKPVDIVVTASKRDTTLQHFAGQWTRIRGSEFSGRGAVGTEAIEARTVGVSSTHLGAGRNKLFIRGIADSSFSGPTQSPVGQYFGDMRTGYSGPDPDLRMVDMDTVEILEGPQGTLYGAGALGGIVLLRPTMPNSKASEVIASAGASATQHGDASYDLAATLNLPLAEDAAIRVTGYHAIDGGYVDNVQTRQNDINRVRVDGGRAIVSAELAPGWSVDLTGAAQRIHGRDSQYADDVDDGLGRRSLIRQPFDSQFALGSLVARKDDGPLRFRSTTGMTRQDVHERFDASADGRIRALDQRSEARQFSSETRLWRPMRDGWSWLAGVSLIENRYTVDRSITEEGIETDLSGVTNRLSETTLYGEVGVALTDRIEASLGGRYTISRLHGSGEHIAPTLFAKVASVDPERTERRLLPSASLVARPFDGLTLYARYQQGFRPGGLSISASDVRFYRHDLLASAEAGFRFGKPRSDRVDLTGSVTRTRWNDIQADYLDPSGLPLTDNIGDGRIWSLSLNGGWKFAPGWRIEAGAAWNDGKITNPSLAFQSIIAAASIAAGNGMLRPGETMRIPNIARIIGRVGLDWVQPLAKGRELTANLYARYVGHSRLGVGPRLGERQGDYFDSGLLVRVKDGNRALSLSVTNLTDSVGNRFAFGAPMLDDTNQLTPLRPRTVRIGLDWGF
ncbi:TonB-dependent receptor domain-containing protein [Sphingomonas jaspsi]|uniref:TonB-dependent receptor domain-containing protein n=1 Tax=Sphingomonas jaspsi TaxID=392409 RepID=UPI0004B18C79|nr:TonB-dependent receptor [Sphingomonas jaspsi]